MLEGSRVLVLIVMLVSLSVVIPVAVSFVVTHWRRHEVRVAVVRLLVGWRSPLVVLKTVAGRVSQVLLFWTASIGTELSRLHHQHLFQLVLELVVLVSRVTRSQAALVLEPTVVLLHALCVVIAHRKP